MKIKSKDIATALGISDATVSLALNNKPGVSKSTRDEIIKYIEMMKTAVQEPVNVSVKTVAIVLPVDTTDSIGGARLFSISYNEIFSVLQKAGYALELIYFNQELERLSSLVQTCKEKNTSGIFLCAYSLKDQELEALADCDIPLLIYDHNHYCRTGDNVLLHNHYGVTEALRYLVKQGHSDIIYIATTENVLNFRERRAAYRSFCKDILHKEPRILITGYSINEINQKVLNFLKTESHLPTAIFTESFKASLGCIKATQECGLCIPDDISIAGFDELPEASLLNFELASVRALHKEAAHLATKRLLERIENPLEASLEIYVRTEFYTGSSVKAI